MQGPGQKKYKDKECLYSILSEIVHATYIFTYVHVCIICKYVGICKTAIDMKVWLYVHMFTLGFLRLLQKFKEKLSTQCRHASQLSCLGRFNNRTCECECEGEEYSQKKLRSDALRCSGISLTSCIHKSSLPYSPRRFVCPSLTSSVQSASPGRFGFVQCSVLDKKIPMLNSHFHPFKNYHVAFEPILQFLSKSQFNHIK